MTGPIQREPFLGRVVRCRRFFQTRDEVLHPPCLKHMVVRRPLNEITGFRLDLRHRVDRSVVPPDEIPSDDFLGEDGSKHALVVIGIEIGQVAVHRIATSRRPAAAPICRIFSSRI